MLNFENVIVA